MQLIVPMSGIGQRFKEAGYKKPKPLIKVEEKTIINHVYEMFPQVSSIFFICNKNHLMDRSFNMEAQIKSFSPEAQIIAVDPHKKGPIHAVLKGLKYFDLDAPTIVNYCDFNCIWDYEKFKFHLKRTNCDGCVVTYTGFHPHMLGNTNYAYLKLKNDQIIDIQEKKPFTSFPMNECASSGTYYFKTASLMKKYFERTVKENLNVGGEYYVSMSFKPMIKDNLILNNFNIDHFMQWGTPEDLKEFNWFSRMFKDKVKESKNHPFLHNGTLMIPCAGLGKRFSDEGYKLPKPLIEVSDKPMLLQAIDDLPKLKNIKLIFKENLERNIISDLLKYNSNIKIKLLKSQTDGQASTCLKGLENSDLYDPLIISACDNGVIYDQNRFNELIKDNSIDIIVWGCRNYPGAIKKPNMYGWMNVEKDIVKKVFVKQLYKDPLKDPIIVGTFYFKKGKIFKKIAEDLIKSNLKVNNEFYVDSCINNAIDLGLKVVYFEVEFYQCWGTPNDLKTYKYWQECFHKWKEHPYNKDLDSDYISSN